MKNLALDGNKNFTKQLKQLLKPKWVLWSLWFVF